MIKTQKNNRYEQYKQYNEILQKYKGQYNEMLKKYPFLIEENRKYDPQTWGKALDEMNLLYKDLELTKQLDENTRLKAVISRLGKTTKTYEQQVRKEKIEIERTSELSNLHIQYQKELLKLYAQTDQTIHDDSIFYQQIVPLFEQVKSLTDTQKEEEEELKSAQEDLQLLDTHLPEIKKRHTDNLSQIFNHIEGKPDLKTALEEELEYRHITYDEIKVNTHLTQTNPFRPENLQRDKLLYQFTGESPHDLTDSYSSNILNWDHFHRHLNDRYHEKLPTINMEYKFMEHINNFNENFVNKIHESTSEIDHKKLILSLEDLEDTRKDLQEASGLIEYYKWYIEDHQRSITHHQQNENDLLHHIDYLLLTESLNKNTQVEDLELAIGDHLRTTRQTEELPADFVHNIIEQLPSTHLKRQFEQREQEIEIKYTNRLLPS